jgi:hypothetical protein
MLKKLKRKTFHWMTHNWLVNSIRHVACGWHKERRHGVTIWYQKVKIYPGYGDYDYEPMFERAVRTVRQNRKKFPGKRVAVEVEVFYSGGRPGIGTRLVQYRIKPYRKVF